MSFFETVEAEDTEEASVAPSLEALPEITEQPTLDSKEPNTGKYSIAPGFGGLPSVTPPTNPYKDAKLSISKTTIGNDLMTGQYPEWEMSSTGQKLDSRHRAKVLNNALYDTIANTLKEPFQLDVEVGGVVSGLDVGRSDDPVEVYNKIVDTFPDYEVKPIEVDDNEHIFMMKGPDEIWKPFNAPNQLSKTDIGAGLGFVLDEQNASAIVGSMISAGASIPIRFASIAGSELIGSMTKQQVEAARGYQEQTGGEQFGRATVDASLGLAIDIPTSGALRMGDVFTGRRGLMNAQPLSRDAYGVMKKYDLPALTPGQMSVLYSRKEAQLAQFDDRPKQRYDEQANALLQELDKLSQGEVDLGTMGTQEIQGLHKDLTSKYLSVISNPEMSPYQAGKQIQEAYEAALTSKAKHFNNEYPRVYEMATGDVTYNAESLKDLSGKWTGSTSMRGKEIGTPELPSRVEDVRVDRDLKDRTRMLFEKLDKIDPTIADYKGSSGLEQLHKLRQQFDNIAFSDEFRGSVDQKAAREARSKISEVIENATGGGETFQQSFKDVNAQYRDYAEGKKLSWARKLMDADDPSVMVRQFTTPNSAAELSYFKSVLPEEEFAVFQQAAGTSLLRDPKNLSRNLADLEKDPDTFNLLFSKSDQQSLRSISTQIDWLESSAVTKTLDRMRTDIEQAKYLAKNSTAGEIDEFLEAGGEPLARTLRAGIIADIQENVMSPTIGTSTAGEAIEKIDRNKFATVITKYQQDPIFRRVFSLDAQKQLGDYKTYAQATSIGSDDTGAALQGASVIGKLGIGDLITRPDEVGAALIKIYGTKREVGPWLSPKFNALIFGGTKDRLATDASIRGAATAITQGMKDFINHSDTVKGDVSNLPEAPVEVPEGFESTDQTSGEDSSDFFNSIEFDELKGSAGRDAMGGVDRSPKDMSRQMTEMERIISGELTGGLTKDIGEKFKEAQTNMSANRIIENTLKHEGGWADIKEDRGGKTNMGITLATYQTVNPSATAEDLKVLTKDEALSFYKENFYDKYRVSEMPTDIQDLYFDMIVNHGPANAAKILQEVLGVEKDGVAGSGTIEEAVKYGGDLRKDLIKGRRRFYNRIIRRDPSQKKFKKGWERRTQAFEGATNA